MRYLSFRLVLLFNRLIPYFPFLAPCSSDACTADQFHCETLNRCISSSLKCDGEDDCGDNSDELPETAGCPAPKEPTEGAPTEGNSAEDKEEQDDKNNNYEFSECSITVKDCNMDSDCKKVITAAPYCMCCQGDFSL